MNTETLKALKGSIEKWEKIVDGSGVDDGADNCPLCILYGPSCIELNEKCLVYQKTGKSSCDASPFRRWADHHEDKHGKPYISQCPTCEQLAKEELKFLKSLLPIKEEVKMKFVIKDDNRKEKDVEIELYLKEYEDRVVLEAKNLQTGASKTIINFKNGRYMKIGSAQLVGIQTDSYGRILEYE